MLTQLCYAQKLEHIIITRKGSQCIIDADNNELIPSGRYRNIWSTYDSAGKHFIVTDFNGKKGIYALGEKELIPCIYDDIQGMGNHGFARKGKYWAVLSDNFKEVSDFIFENVFYFNKEGRTFVKHNSQWVLIDTSGKIIKKIPFETVYQFGSHDLYKKAGLKNLFGYIDQNANVIIPPEYEDVSDAIYSEQVFPVKRNGKWGYVNKENKLIVPFKYRYVTPIYKGIGWIRDINNKTIGIVDARGRLIFDDGRYQDVEYGYEGKLIFTQKDRAGGNGLQGYLDSTTLRILIPAQFDDCEIFFRGLAVVRKHGLSAIIDSNGNFVLPFYYESISPWGDHFIVSKKGKWGMIDRKGKVLTPMVYDKIGYSGLHATIYKGNYQGILHYSGKVYVMPKYEQVRRISDNVFYAVKEGKNFLVNSDGKEELIK